MKDETESGPNDNDQSAAQTTESADSGGAAEAASKLDEAYDRLRKGMSGLARAQEFAKAKRLYELLYPETRQGGARGKAGGGKAKNATVAPFVKAAAAATGLSARLITYDIAIATGISRDVLGRLEGTTASNATTALVALAKLPTITQRALMSGLSMKGDWLPELRKRIEAESPRGTQDPRAPTVAGSEVEITLSGTEPQQVRGHRGRVPISVALVTPVGVDVVLKLTFGTVGANGTPTTGPEREAPNALAAPAPVVEGAKGPGAAQPHPRDLVTTAPGVDDPRGPDAPAPMDLVAVPQPTVLELVPGFAEAFAAAHDYALSEEEGLSLFEEFHHPLLAIAKTADNMDLYNLVYGSAEDFARSAVTKKFNELDRLAKKQRVVSLSLVEDRTLRQGCEILVCHADANDAVVFVGVADVEQDGHVPRVQYCAATTRRAEVMCRVDTTMLDSHRTRMFVVGDAAQAS